MNNTIDIILYDKQHLELARTKMLVEDMRDIKIIIYKEQYFISSWINRAPRAHLAFIAIDTPMHIDIL